MELEKNDVLFLVRHHVTEDDLQRLEKGTRLLGLRGSVRKILTVFLIIAIVSLAIKGFFSGIMSMIFSALGGAALLISFAGFYVLTKGWADSKADIKRKFKENRADYEMEREYRFYEEYYEMVSEFEYMRLEYKNIGRMLDMSGMFVLLEKGDVIRFFMKEDVKQGDAVEFAAFLERKCETTMEFVSMR